MRNECIEVDIVTVCGKQAKKLIFNEIKINRRKAKLKKLIKEVRQLRKKLNEQKSN